MTNFSNPRTISWLGPNLEKAKRVYAGKQERAKKEFIKKYPHAKIDEFEFRASVNDQGNLVQQSCWPIITILLLRIRGQLHRERLKKSILLLFTRDLPLFGILKVRCNLL